MEATLYRAAKWGLAPWCSFSLKRNNWNHLKRCSVLPETFLLPVHSSTAVWIVNLAFITQSSREGGEEGKTWQNLAFPKTGELPRETNHLIISRADSQCPLFVPTSRWRSLSLPVTLNAESFLCVAVLCRKPLVGKGNGKNGKNFQRDYQLCLQDLKSLSWMD